MFLRKKKATKKKPKRKTAKKKPAFGGYMIKPDENFAKIVGSKPLSPSQMTKQVWVYIKKKKLANK
ncbi:MAG: SWIB/MDM2 domain-containing protein [Candidatus Aenigmatarchaeota archaeon]